MTDNPHGSAVPHADEQPDARPEPAGGGDRVPIPGWPHYEADLEGHIYRTDIWGQYAGRPLQTFRKRGHDEPLVAVATGSKAVGDYQKHHVPVRDLLRAAFGAEIADQIELPEPETRYQREQRSIRERAAAQQAWAPGPGEAERGGVPTISDPAGRIKYLEGQLRREREAHEATQRQMKGIAERMRLLQRRVYERDRAGNGGDGGGGEHEHEHEYGGTSMSIARGRVEAGVLLTQTDLEWLRNFVDVVERTPVYPLPNPVPPDLLARMAFVCGASLGFAAWLRARLPDDGGADDR